MKNWEFIKKKYHLSSLSFFFSFFSDCSKLHLHGSVQESSVLVRLRGGPRRVLEESSSERFVFIPVLHNQSFDEPADRKRRYLLAGFCRSFLRRLTARCNRVHWQSTVGGVQKQQQLGGKRLLSCLWRYNTDNVGVWITCLRVKFSEFQL